MVTVETKQTSCKYLSLLCVCTVTVKQTLHNYYKLLFAQTRCFSLKWVSLSKFLGHNSTLIKMSAYGIEELSA